MTVPWPALADTPSPKEPIAIFSRVRQALPVRPFAGALILRAATLWVLLRLSFALLDYRLAYRLTWPSLVTVFGIIVLTAVLGLIDVRRRREHILLANLGVGQAALTALMLIPPVVFEVLMALITPL